jgi:transcriptional regulator with XRE-family HTH domain
MARKREQELAMVRAIRTAIEKSGLTLLELWERSGVHHSALSRFLRGERTLTLPAVAKVVDALGFEIELVPKKGKPPPPPRHGSSEAPRRRGRPRKTPPSPEKQSRGQKAKGD